MSRTQHLIPRTGTKVIDPADGNALPADGKTVAIDTYWRRRLADGDVSVKPRTRAAKTTATSAAKE